MAAAIQHQRIRDLEDRSYTFALLDEITSASTPEAERGEAFRTLAQLEDYRSIGPLTAIVDDDEFPESVREVASTVLWGFDDTTTGRRRRGWWDSGDPVKMAHALRFMERSEADVVVAIAGDHAHPLQKLGLAGMAFGFDEAEFQPIKIRALAYPDADIREAAADVLLWDEPVAAEEALLNAASDPSSDVAVAAVDTLQYYPSRRVLRALADMADTDDDAVRVKAAASFDYNRSRFESVAASAEPEHVVLLREWMKPVADLVRWPDEVHDPKAVSRPPARPGVVMSESALLALIADSDGEWAAKKRALHAVAWEAFGSGQRARLSKALSTHPDPVVRMVATAPLAAWSRSEELLDLAGDPCSSVRKCAVYSLGLVRTDPAIAAFAWEYMLTTGGTTAYEALNTYVDHAPAGEARERLVDLARADRRESIRTTAISRLVDQRAVAEVESLVPLLREPPGVTWAVHIQILNGLQKLGLPGSALDDLATADNLDLIDSVVALRCSSTS